jgi:Right handed beta helix region
MWLFEDIFNRIKKAYNSIGPIRTFPVICLVVMCLAVSSIYEYFELGSRDLTFTYMIKKRVFQTFSSFYIKNAFHLFNPNHLRYSIDLFGRNRGEDSSVLRNFNLEISQRELMRIYSPHSMTYSDRTWPRWWVDRGQMKTASAMLEIEGREYPVLVRLRGELMNHWAGPFKSWRARLVPQNGKEFWPLPTNEINIIIAEYYYSEWFGGEIAKRAGLKVVCSEPIEFKVNGHFEGLRYIQGQPGDGYMRHYGLPIGFIVDPVHTVLMPDKEFFQLPGEARYRFLFGSEWVNSDYRNIQYNFSPQELADYLTFVALYPSPHSRHDTRYYLHPVTLSIHIIPWNIEGQHPEYFGLLNREWVGYLNFWGRGGRGKKFTEEKILPQLTPQVFHLQFRKLYCETRPGGKLSLSVLDSLVEEHVAQTAPSIDRFPWGYTTSGTGYGGSPLFWQDYSYKRKIDETNIWIIFARNFEFILEELLEAKVKCEITASPITSHGTAISVARIRLNVKSGAGVNLNNFEIKFSDQASLNDFKTTYLIFDRNGNGKIDHEDGVVAKKELIPSHVTKSLILDTKGVLLYYEGIEETPQNYYDLYLVLEVNSGLPDRLKGKILVDSIGISATHPFSGKNAIVLSTNELQQRSKIIGNMTLGRGLAYVFDGITAQTSAAAASIASNTGYAGKDWGEGNKKIISSVTLFGTTDWGFRGGGESVTATLQGSNDNFSSIVDLGEVAIKDKQSAIIKIMSQDTTTPYRYHRVKLFTEVPNAKVAEIVFKENTLTIDTSSTTSLNNTLVALTDTLMFPKVDDRILYRLTPWNGEHPDTSLQEHRFVTELPEFVVPDGENGFRISSGTHEVLKSVFLPDGKSLTIAPGTTLKIAEGACVYILGSVTAEGTPDNPIFITNLEAGQKTGNMVVNYTKGKPSSFKHCVFEKTGEFKLHNWTYSGGLNIYGANATVDHCVFRDISGEDGLNVKWADVAVQNCQFSNVAFDAIDYDFAPGIVSQCTFLNCGNDAIDLGESTTMIDDCRINRAKDKGISIGGRSYLAVRNCFIENADIGIQVKDDSKVDIIDTNIHTSRIGVHANIKKVNRKSMSVLLKNVSFSDNQINELADEGTNWYAIQHDHRMR